MKTDQVSIGKQRILFSGLFAFLAALWPALVFAQWDFAPPTTPNAQRNALNVVHSQVNCLQNKTRTASNLVGEQGYGSLRHEFEVLRLAYVEFARTLTPQQVERGAKSLVELNDGLDIIEGAFANYAENIAAGKPAGAALHNLCGVLRQSSALWRKELDRTASRLRVGVERAGTTTPSARTMKPVGSTGTSCAARGLPSVRPASGCSPRFAQNGHGASKAEFEPAPAGRDVGLAWHQGLPT